jgi:hypothetical protein
MRAGHAANQITHYGSEVDEIIWAASGTGAASVAATTNRSVGI